MEPNELSSAWRAAAQAYAQAVNDFVERGLRDGWPDEDPEFPDRQSPLADAVLQVVREANRSGNTSTLRERFPPAVHPFAEKVKTDGRALVPAMWLDDENVAIRVGAPYEAGPTLIVNTDGINECPGILSFGRSHDRTFVALAKQTGIEIRRGWNGEVTATVPWPESTPLTVTNLAVFPDGERVLLTSASGIFILTRDRAVALFPDRDLSMEHAALSPDGTLILAGHQSSSHVAFDADGRQIAEVNAHSEYPHFAWFSADGSIAAFNACHFYNGESIGVVAADLRKKTIFGRVQPKVRTLQEGARVYAAVARDDEFIVGDAFGYLRAFDTEGNFRWQRFIGSTIIALDLSPNGRKLAVTSYAALLCVLDLDATERDPYTVSTGSRHPRELWRWLFWKNEERPLRW